MRLQLESGCRTGWESSKVTNHLADEGYITFFGDMIARKVPSMNTDTRCIHWYHRLNIYRSQALYELDPLVCRLYVWLANDVIPFCKNKV